MNIEHIAGEMPHEDYGGWANFLATTCEVRDQHEGTTHYGSVNCNYIVFPCGTLVSNFGFHGKALMDRVRKEGPAVVLASIRSAMREVHMIVEKRHSQE